MGSPVAVSVANLVIEYVEEKALSAVNFSVQFYRHFIDDTFVILGKQYIEPFHNVLNSLHLAIQFTKKSRTY